MPDLDIRDILLEAQADLAEIMREVMEELTLPIMTQALKMKWATMPEELKEMLKEQNPQAYDKLIQMVQERS